MNRPNPNRWQIVIPNWCPPSLNKGRGRHFAKADACVKEVVEFLTAYNAKVACPKVSDEYRPRRRLTVHVCKNGTYPDPDNLLKYLLDGLKRAGLIVDDSAKWCQWETPEMFRPIAGQFGGGKGGTVITIEDIEDIEDAPSVQSEQEPGTVGGVRLTRAVCVGRAWYRPHDTTLAAVCDFYVYCDSGGGSESCFLSHVACTEYERDKRIKWAEALGIPVKREDFDPQSEPAKVACDDALIW